MSAIQRVTLQQELERNPELNESDIKLLREWCEKQPHLPKILDSELVLFLYSNYYNIEKAKTTIEAFYSMRTNAKEYFSQRNPLENDELRQTFKIVTFLPLKGQTREGYKVFLGRLINFDSSLYHWYSSMKLFHMVFDLWMYTEGSVKGHIFLFDMTGASLGHSTRINLLGCRKLINYLQDALPVRLKGIHFMNSLSIVQIVLGMTKPLMRKELTQILHVHTNDETLNKFIPLEILPNELGGKAGPLMELHEKQIKFLEDHRDFFVEEEVNSRVNDSLRPSRFSGWFRRAPRSDS